jgi:hypothetical protein
LPVLGTPSEDWVEDGSRLHRDDGLQERTWRASFVILIFIIIFTKGQATLFAPGGTAPIGKEKEQDKNRPCLPTIPEIVSL